MEYEFTELIKRLDEINRQINQFLFSSKVAKDYITSNFVRTIMLHISYLYFYGITNDWCNQIYRFYMETLDLKKSDKGKKVGYKYVYNMITNNMFYANFMADDKNVSKFVKYIPSTESGAPLQYNLPLDVKTYKEYVKDFIDYIFNNNHAFFTSDDIKDFALLQGCVDTER